MSSLELYLLFLGLIGCERLVELYLSKRNAAWSFARGGKEFGRGHFPVMAVLHTVFLLGCGTEVWFCERPFWPLLGWPMLAIALACQGLRYWVITTLGPQWNTRVIVVPGLARVNKGPFLYLRHPNYVAVVLEGIAVPLVHGAWVTAVLFSVANGFLLRVRLRCEEQALQLLKKERADA